MRFALAPIMFVCSLFLFSAQAQAEEYPELPEPMVFDMVRSLGARAGQVEVNALARTQLSGPNQTIEWAPEIEVTVADGFGVEFELPMEGGKVTEYKLGLQGTIGAYADGQGAHGIEYLGIYNRESGKWENNVLYVNGVRLNERWSMLGMVGIGDLHAGKGGGGRLLVNHSTFYELTEKSRVGLEMNFKSGAQHEALIMPQFQHHLNHHIAIQAGVGAIHSRANGWRPQVGLRLIAVK